MKFHPTTGPRRPTPSSRPDGRWPPAGRSPRRRRRVPRGLRRACAGRSCRRSSLRARRQASPPARPAARRGAAADRRRPPPPLLSRALLGSRHGPLELVLAHLRAALDVEPPGLGLELLARGRLALADRVRLLAQGRPCLRGQVLEGLLAASPGLRLLDVALGRLALLGGGHETWLPGSPRLDHSRRPGPSSKDANARASS